MDHNKDDENEQDKIEKFNLLKDFSRSMSEAPEAIPDVEQLLDHVISMLEYMDTDDMKNLEETDPDAFEKHLDAKFCNFTYRYYAVFKLLLDKQNRKENVARMINLFQKLNQIKNNETTMDDAYEEYTEGLNNKYIYPKFGGKANFVKSVNENKEKEAKEKKTKKR